MNAESHELTPSQVHTYDLVQAGDMLFDTTKFGQLERFAQIMASGTATVPRHLSGNVGDCLAVTMQAMQWGMNPFAVAQKTHLVNGILGYEAQLVNAVITSMAPTTGRIQYEWFGDWERVIGNFIEKTSQKGNKYTAPAWNFNDEKGLGVKVWATLKGESKSRVLNLLLSQAQPRNSTLWATDPKQQIAYLAVKRWSRLFCPDVILGVYSDDELEMGNQHVSDHIIESETVIEDQDLPEYPKEKFNDSLPRYKKMIADDVKTASEIINQLEMKYTLTDDQKLTYEAYEQEIQEHKNETA